MAPRGVSVRRLTALVVLGLLTTTPGAPAQAEPETRVIVANADADRAGGLDLAWKVQTEIYGDQHPRSRLGIVIDGREVAVREAQPVDYDAIPPGAWDTPDDAVMAVLGWYAGRGEVLYVDRTADSVRVHMRRIEEEEAEERFRLVQTIPLASGPR